MLSVDALIFFVICAACAMIFYKTPPRIVYSPDHGKWFVVRYDVSLIRYVALSHEEDYWWMTVWLWNEYAGFNTEAEAIERLKRYKERK